LTKFADFLNSWDKTELKGSSCEDWVSVHENTRLSMQQICSMNNPGMIGAR
jgi:hypothetical protein